MAFRSSNGLSGGNGTSAAVPVPAGAAVGDIAVVGVYKENTAAVTAPGGFTQKAALTTSGTSRGTLYVYWKRLTAADSGTYSFSWSGNTFRAGASALFSGRIASGDPFDGTVGTAESTTSVASLNVSTSPASASGDAVGMWTDFTGGNTWTAPTNYTEREDRDVITLDTRDAVASGSTGSISATANVSGFMKAFLGVLKAAAGATVNGTAEGSFGFTGTAAGVDRALGVATGSFGFTATASGIAGTPPVTGQAVGAFGFTGTAAGVPRTSGTAAASFGFTATAAGVDRALGAALAAFGFTATAAGVDRAVGAAVASFGFTATASGRPRSLGLAVAAFGFTGAATGFAGTPPVTGAAVGLFGFTATAQGQPYLLGAASASFGFTATAAGRPRVVAVAVVIFGFTGTATGKRRVFAVSQAPFGFTATADGLAIGPIVPGTAHPAVGAVAMAGAGSTTAATASAAVGAVPTASGA